MTTVASPSYPRRSLLAYHAGLGTLGAVAAFTVAIARSDALLQWRNLVWVGVIALISLFPVETWKGAIFSVDDPLLCALAISFPPEIAFLICFVGCVDPRELRGTVSFGKALFNRAQCGGSIALASVAAGLLEGLSPSGLWALAQGVVAIAVNSSANVAVVAYAMSLETRQPFHSCAKALLSESPGRWALSYLSFGLIGGLIAHLYSDAAVGPWLVVASAVSFCTLARGMLLNLQSARNEAALIAQREAILTAASDQIALERRGERRDLAGALHDEVIPSLEGIDLLVLSASSGSSVGAEALEMLGRVREAARESTRALRRLVGDLARSDGAPADLSAAVQGFWDAEQHRFGVEAEFTHEIQRVTMPSVVRLLIYQIIREGLANAVAHSRARKVWASLRTSGDEVRIELGDDGIGFSPGARRDDHYGLELMQQRAQALQADLDVKSGPDGTLVVVTIPVSWALSTADPRDD